MNKALSLILLIAGIALVVFGLIAMDSFSSSVSRFFTGSPTDKSIWMVIGGAALIAVSGFGFLRASD